LAEAGLPVICDETRHMKADQQENRNDARGIAQMMRVGLYRPGACEDALASQKRRLLLTSRQLLQAKALDIENDLRGTVPTGGAMSPQGRWMRRVRFESLCLPQALRQGRVGRLVRRILLNPSWEGSSADPEEK
jgi:hypothetical protein